MFTVTTSTINALYPRSTGATHLPSDRLKLVYHKYKTTASIPDNVTKINLIFAHGTGMNKSVWKYHVEKFYEASATSKDWKLDSVVVPDAVGHCDSALLNKGKLGWSCDWRDGGKDLISVVKNEIDVTGDFVPGAYTRNILIGHSMGGYQVAYAGFLESVLFDSVVSIEPVLFYDQQYTEFFANRISKMSKMITDVFPNAEAANKWFKQISFYKTLDKRVLDDFVADELYEEDGKVKVKSTNPAQIAAYLTAPYCVEKGMAVLPHIDIPFMHVRGMEAMWNPPEATDFIRESVKAELIEGVDVEGGDHLLHGTLLDETMKVLIGFVDRRAAWVKDHRGTFPEVKHNGDRAAIFESQWPFMMKGDVESSFYYATPRPKL